MHTCAAQHLPGMKSFLMEAVLIGQYERFLSTTILTEKIENTLFELKSYVLRKQPHSSTGLCTSGYLEAVNMAS